VEVWRKKYAQGDVVVVRYADDIILGFQHQAEADRFLENFRERLGKFGLELHPDKTRRIEFGRFAEQNRERRGEGKPETFDFLATLMHSTVPFIFISKGKPSRACELCSAPPQSASKTHDPGQ
jgi:hypothetical protein